MEAYISNIIIWTIVFVFVLLSILHWHLSSWRVNPIGIPWVPQSRRDQGILCRPYARLRAHLQDLTKGGEFVQQGYLKYGKMGKPFVVPSFVTWQPEVVLPPSQLQWLIDQPDSVLSIDRALIKDLEFSHTTPKAWSFTRPFHVEAINKLKLEASVGDMAEEVATGLKLVWGVDTENWTEVNIEHTMASVLLRVTSRVFVGAPLCCDEEYLKPAGDFLSALGTRSILISLTPELLRPFVAKYLTRDLKKWNQQCAALTMPLIAKELERRQSDQRDASSPAKTLLESISHVASRSAHTKDQDLFSIASRLLALNFVAVHTSNHALVNALVNIASPSATAGNVFRHIRIEANQVYQQHNGKWSKAALSQLVKTDSALRESLRLHTFKARGLERIVVKKDGVVLPSGQYLAKGTKVGIAVLPTHRDPDVYKNALTYDAFRFCRTADADAATKPSFNADLVNSSETFLAFGHGKHVCPGRFLAAYEMKLIVAYIALNYDVEPLVERPENVPFSDFTSGAMHCLRVRRRGKGT